MTRSKSILPTVLVCFLGVVLTGAAVVGLRMWQARSLGLESLDGPTPEVARADAAPVRLWHESRQAADGTGSSDSASKPGSAPFAWALPEAKRREAEQATVAAPPPEPLAGPEASSDEAASVREPGGLAEVAGAPLPRESSADEADVIESPIAASDPSTSGRPLQLASTGADGAANAAADDDSTAADPAASDPAAAPPVRPLPTETAESPEPSAVAADSATESPEPASPSDSGPGESPSGLEVRAAPENAQAVEEALRARIVKTPSGPSSPTTIQEAPAVDGLDTTRAWPQSPALRSALSALASDHDGNAWAGQVTVALDKLEAAPAFNSPESNEALAQLASLAEIAQREVAAQEVSPLQAKLLRANYALQRRLAVWKSIVALGALPESVTAPPVDRLALAKATSGVDAFLAASGRQAEWRQFLLMEDVVAAIKNSEETTSSASRSLARCILARLDSTLLTPSQARFLDRPVFHQWTGLLQQWAVEPIDRSALLKTLEKYEAAPSASTARELARTNQILRWGPHETLTNVGAQMNLHYRNANVRFAIAGDLANRLLPPLRQFNAPVNDVIRNTHVVGHSQTAARTRLVLFPDRTRWHVGLDVLGSVASETQGQRGPAVFFQDGQARFHARKLIEVDHRGIQTKPAFGVAEASSQLVGLETDFDGVPLMNRLARSVAQKQYDEESGLAQSEVENRIATEASERLDLEVRQILAESQKKLDAQLIRPLSELGLEPTPIDYETTRTRLITRYRLAGSHQLAANSPRPQAPSNSLLSVQVHESALNNIAEQLRLDGRDVELPELIRDLAGRLGRKDVVIPDDLPEDVRVKFAAEDAVRVRLEEGRVTVAIQVAELSQGRENRWRNFVVRASYVPRITGRQIELVRDGIIELGGERRRIGDQVALRGIFAKVLSKNRPIALIPDSIVQRRELSDIEASQAVVEDGWIGISLAQGGSVARQPSARPAAQR